jgi:hypothetical protein
MNDIVFAETSVDDLVFVQTYVDDLVYVDTTMDDVLLVDASVDDVVFVASFKDESLKDMVVTWSTFDDMHPKCICCQEYLGLYNMRQLCNKTTCDSMINFGYTLQSDL